MKILAMNAKKIVPWGNGLAVYLTKVVVYTIENSEGKGIIIKKAPIKV